MIRIADSQTIPMNWQTKVEAWMAARNLNPSRVAAEIGVTGPGLRKVLDNPSGWSTVQTAIRLAQMMETTVEYLFDDQLDWPPPRPRAPDSDQARMAIQALERIAWGRPATDPPPESPDHADDPRAQRSPRHK